MARPVTRAVATDRGATQAEQKQRPGDPAGEPRRGSGPWGTLGQPCKPLTNGEKGGVTHVFEKMRVKNQKMKAKTAG